jgi:hypothetical protein
MKQGRKLAVTCAVIAALALAAPMIADAAPRSSAKGASATTRRSTLRQFSGVVTAVEKSSLTVAKSGKNPRSVVFEKDAEMSTTGAIEKDARVTVYYRDEDGRTIAHRVVVKPPGRAAKAAASR